MNTNPRRADSQPRRPATPRHQPERPAAPRREGEQRERARFWRRFITALTLPLLWGLLTPCWLPATGATPATSAHLDSHLTVPHHLGRTHGHDRER